MKRSTFIQQAGLLTAGLFVNKSVFAAFDDRPTNRPPVAKRNFTSTAVEDAIKQFKAKVPNKELAWMFENCFPNTLDTTVFHSTLDGKPDTYVITGDIDAMWLRDSSAQVWPYLTFIKKDKHLQQMVAGVINRQMRCVQLDPYANAFYKDETKESEWKSDHTDMKKGVHERKWEIDSLCYPLRLSYHYWKNSGDTQPFDDHWKKGVKIILDTFKVQQRKTGKGPYHFQRDTNKPTDTLPMDGYGFPVKPTGLICSMFRPSDDATIYPYLIPSNFFAVISLKQTAELLQTLKEGQLASELLALATEVEQAIHKHGIVNHPYAGKIYAFEVDGMGNVNCMDDANVPSLLALPYLGAVSTSDPIYQNTRKFVLSGNNPYFYKSKIAEGIGGPHVGKDGMIWPLSFISRGLTSTDPKEIKHCIQMLQATHAGTGFIHESFNKDNPADFTRSWFAWANTIFGEFLWKTFQHNPQLLS
ncbi:glycoside hydrolase family 125 protein [Mucilaginibacter sp. RS28]|uniref:Glycoside hydrolase family 125 protein n=1 Tax=Mucilaginibacter straminoryzae TaxID=2932774 RepID=A0A9X1X724_9SPHI|nr:glycoside hydrolase family 125 protein [Mucilaginibacter straminoryzae]MCJ8209824.1 glycoside hydrolase family 125 protein [Mucilaginibacter straminoryzae]